MAPAARASVLIAAGTQPNTVLAREEGVSLELDGKYFLAATRPARRSARAPYRKPKSPEVLLHRYPDGRFISFFGDLHPSYFGNVVKAMGSAKQGYLIVRRFFQAAMPLSPGRREVPSQAQSRSARGGARCAA